MSHHEFYAAATAVAAASEFATSADELLDVVATERPGQDYAVRGLRSISDAELREAVRPLAADVEPSSWTWVVYALGYLSTITTGRPSGPNPDEISDE